eukprot:1353418-Rhodomonas_salina.1
MVLSMHCDGGGSELACGATGVRGTELAYCSGMCGTDLGERMVLRMYCSARCSARIWCYQRATQCAVLSLGMALPGCIEQGEHHA